MDKFPSARSVLRGKKVYLRKPTYGELEYIRTLWADPETMKDVGGPYLDFGPERADKWYRAWVDPGRSTHCYFLILAVETDTPVGEISFRNFDQSTRSAWFDIKIEAAHRGKGFARDAMDVFFRYYFGELGGEVMYDDIALDNPGGQQALIKYGFRHDPSREDVFLVCLDKETFYAT